MFERKSMSFKEKVSMYSERLAPYVFLSPFLFYITVFFGYAFIRSVYFSFTNYDMFHEPEFVGLDNYISIFKQNLFLIALKNSITFSLIVTFAQTAGALLLAIVMNQKIKGIAFFRGLYYLPSVTSSIVITMIFMWVFQRQGIFNFLLTSILRYGISIISFIMLMFLIQGFLINQVKKQKKHDVSFFEPGYFSLSLFLSLFSVFILTKISIIPLIDVNSVQIIWLNTREMIPKALGSFGIPRPLFSIMILNTWTTIPTMSLLYLAGLQDISPALYEAADVDGASSFQKFIYITVPQLNNVTFLVVTLGLIGTLKMFDQVAIIGNQAPLESIVTLAYYVYNNAFPSSGIPNIGMASSAAIILGILTLIIVYIQKKFQNI